MDPDNADEQIVDANTLTFKISEIVQQKGKEHWLATTWSGTIHPDEDPLDGSDRILNYVMASHEALVLSFLEYRLRTGAN